MSQSSITAAALVIAFVIFVTVRGELPIYFGAFGIGKGAMAVPGATAAGFGLASNYTALAGSTPTVQYGGGVQIGGGGNVRGGVQIGVGAGGVTIGGGVGFPGGTIGIQLPPIGGGGGGGGWGGGNFGGFGFGGFCDFYPELCDPNQLPPGGFPFPGYTF